MARTDKKTKTRRPRNIAWNITFPPKYREANHLLMLQMLELGLTSEKNHYLEVLHIIDSQWLPDHGSNLRWWQFLNHCCESKTVVPSHASWRYAESALFCLHETGSFDVHFKAPTIINSYKIPNQRSIILTHTKYQTSDLSYWESSQAEWRYTIVNRTSRICALVKWGEVHG